MNIKKRELYDKTNLFRKQTLNIFENVKRIVFVNNYYYSLSLLDLLTVIDSSRVQQVTMKFGGYSNNWYTRLPSKSVDNIKQKYNEKNYKIDYVTKDESNWIQIKMQ